MYQPKEFVAYKKKVMTMCNLNFTNKFQPNNMVSGATSKSPGLLLLRLLKEKIRIVNYEQQ